MPDFVFEPDQGGTGESFRAPQFGALDSSGKANKDRLLNKLRQIVETARALELDLEERMSSKALLVGDFDSRLKDAHESEWIEDAGTLPGEITYRYYKYLRLRNNAAAAYIRKRYEEAARDVTGDAAFDLLLLNDAAKKEALLAIDFLEKDVFNLEDTAEERILEELEAWAQGTIVRQRKIQAYLQQGPSREGRPSQQEIATTSSTEARRGQAVLKANLNGHNDEISREYGLLKRYFIESGPQFYNKFLTPALRARKGATGKKNHTLSGQTKKSVENNALALDLNLKSLIEDQFRRKRIFNQSFDNILASVEKRDQSRENIKALSEIGKDIPSTGPRVMVNKTDEQQILRVFTKIENEAEVGEFDSSGVSDLTQQAKIISNHGDLEGLDQDDHPQYLLKEGGTLSGSVSMVPGVKVDGMRPATHAHTGEDGTVRIKGSDIIKGTLPDDVIDRTPPAAPTDLQVTGYDSTIVPPGVTAIDTGFSFQSDPRLQHELEVRRISDPPPLTPTSLELTQVGTVSSLTQLEFAHDVKVVGNYAYVTAQFDDALTVVDVSDPANPVIVGSVVSALLNEAAGLDVVSNYAYVCGSFSDALVVFDISNPANPVQVGSLQNTDLNGIHDIRVSGNYAFVVTDVTEYFVTIDISDPTNPTQVGTPFVLQIPAGFEAEPKDLELSGNYAYVADRRGQGLIVVDVTDPLNPTQVGSVTSVELDGPSGVAISGNYAYVTAIDTETLNVIDITTPTSPSQVASVAGSNMINPYKIAVDGTYAYVTGGNTNSLTVFDITDPLNPAEVASLSSIDMDGAHGVWVVGEFIYVTALVADSLTILRLQAVLA